MHKRELRHQNLIPISINTLVNAIIQSQPSPNRKTENHKLKFRNKIHFNILFVIHYSHKTYAPTVTIKMKHFAYIKCR